MSWLLLVLAASSIAQESDWKDLGDLESSAEQYDFQAEVASLMDIIINSLYMNKEVFLRELISNASDAMDKIRFLSTLNSDISTSDLEIRIEFNEEAKTLSIRDKGVGMTKLDLIEKLGTVAKSGTTQFIEAIATGGDINLIGQFGVGFYSSFLAAEKVVVVSKHDDDDQYIWSSNAGSSFSVVLDPRGNTLERGTEVIMHVKQEAEEFLSQDRLKEVIKRYSEFIDYPIYLHVQKEKYVQVPIEDEDEEQPEDHEEHDHEDHDHEDHDHEDHDHDDHDHEDHDHEDHDHEDTEEATEDQNEEQEEAKPKTKSVTEKVWEWEQVNSQKAIWLKDKSELKVKDYVRLFKVINKDGSEPLYLTHFSGEGEVEFKAIVFFPENPPFDLFENYNKKVSGLRLYCRRVMITDEYEDMVPRYMNFLKGVIHSDDIPLNVSRENLQQQRVIKIISKKIVQKVLDVLGRLADEKEEIEIEDKPEKTAEDEQEEIPDVEETEAEKKEREEEEQIMLRWNRYKGSKRFAEIWKVYSKHFKLGLIEDSTNRTRLAKLFRFYSTKSLEELTSFDQYIDRMKEGQDKIYYLAGESKKGLDASPIIEALKEKDIEVMLLDDPLDEYAMNSLKSYSDKDIVNASRGVLDVSYDDYELAREKKLKELYQPLTDWFKALLGKDVESVTVSRRLTKDPVVVSTTENSYTANLERIQRSQAYANQNKFPEGYAAKKVLELNPGHVVIKKFLERVEDDPESKALEDQGWLLYQSALLSSGFPLREDTTFSSRLQRSLRNKMSIHPAEIISEPEIEFDFEDEQQVEHDEEIEEIEDLESESLDEPEEPTVVKDEL